MKKIKLNLPPGQSFLTNGNGVYDVYAIPSLEHGLNQIPKGMNPRDLNPDSEKVKNIKASLLKNDGSFLTKCGGMQITIDNGSFEFDSDNSCITFTCDWGHNPPRPLSEGRSGHYDGQHSGYAITTGLQENPNVNEIVKLTLVERSVFPTIADQRGAAKAWNNRTNQKQSSEENMLGLFDDLKSNIKYTDIKNIGWKQYQKNAKGEKITAANEVQQVIRLLSTFFPLTYETGLGVPDIAKLPKAGETTAINMLINDKYKPYTLPTQKHVDYVLELSDYIQSTMENILGSDFNEFPLIKQSGASQLLKQPSKRSFFRTNLFNGQEAIGALNKDYILMFVYAVVSNCYEWDEKRQEYDQKHSIASAKAIWSEYGKRLLDEVNRDFIASFANSSKSRKSDFVNQHTKWSLLSNLIFKGMRDNKWKNRINTSLKAKAA
tara:strand:+ start:110 stop:1411 length:1302 start_codon:yes stop_codon:yes gene_type:complete